MQIFNNPVSRVGAYSRAGAYSREALNRSITVYQSSKFVFTVKSVRHSFHLNTLSQGFYKELTLPLSVHDICVLLTYFSLHDYFRKHKMHG